MLSQVTHCCGVIPIGVNDGYNKISPTTYSAGLLACGKLGRVETYEVEE